jgi:flagellar biogenesis protein FliO
MKQEASARKALNWPQAAAGGLTGWLLGKLRVVRRARPRLAVLERITLAPRQSLALIEVDGRRFLVALSAEGTPAFHSLDPETPAPSQSAAGPVRPFARPAQERTARVSW